MPILQGQASKSSDTRPPQGVERVEQERYPRFRRLRPSRSRRNRLSNSKALYQKVELSFREKTESGFWQTPSRGKIAVLGRSSIKSLARPARSLWEDLVSSLTLEQRTSLKKSPGWRGEPLKRTSPLKRPSPRASNYGNGSSGLAETHGSSSPTLKVSDLSSDLQSEIFSFANTMEPQISKSNFTPKFRQVVNIDTGISRLCSIRPRVSPSPSQGQGKMGYTQGEPSLQSTLAPFKQQSIYSSDAQEFIPHVTLGKIVVGSASTPKAKDKAPTKATQEIATPILEDNNTKATLVIATPQVEDKHNKYSNDFRLEQRVLKLAASAAFHESKAQELETLVTRSYDVAKTRLLKKKLFHQRFMANLFSFLIANKTTSSPLESRFYKTIRGMYSENIREITPRQLFSYNKWVLPIEQKFSHTQSTSMEVANQLVTPIKTETMATLEKATLIEDKLLRLPILETFKEFNTLKFSKTLKSYLVSQHPILKVEPGLIIHFSNVLQRHFDALNQPKPVSTPLVEKSNVIRRYIIRPKKTEEITPKTTEEMLSTPSITKDRHRKSKQILSQHYEALSVLGHCDVPAALSISTANPISVNFALKKSVSQDLDKEKPTFPVLGLVPDQSLPLPVLDQSFGVLDFVSSFESTEEDTNHYTKLMAVYYATLNKIKLEEKATKEIATRVDLEDKPKATSEIATPMEDKILITSEPLIYSLPVAPAEFQHFVVRKRDVNHYSRLIQAYNGEPFRLSQKIKAEYKIRKEQRIAADKILEDIYYNALSKEHKYKLFAYQKEREKLRLLEFPDAFMDPPKVETITKWVEKDPIPDPIMRIYENHEPKRNPLRGYDAPWSRDNPPISRLQHLRNKQREEDVNRN